MSTPAPTVADLPAHRITVERWLALVEAGALAPEDRVELLDGRMVAMTPQGPAHAWLITDLAHRLRALLPGGVVVLEEKPLHLSDVSLPEPDLMIVPAGLSRSRYPTADVARLVVEVAATSQRADRVKAGLYAAAGISELWLIDLPAREVVVHREPQADGSWADVQRLSADAAVPVPGTEASVVVGELLGR